MLQRIGIAQALINDPQLLILDEPMSGLDPFGRKEMRDIILSCREKGKTVIFSSHILSDVEMMCDRYGLYALVRMLYHNPEYRTISTIDEQVSFEENIRKLISIEIGKTKRLSHQALRGKFTKIVNTLPLNNI